MKQCSPITAIFPTDPSAISQPCNSLLQAAAVGQSTKPPKMKPIYNTCQRVHRLARSSSRQDSELLRSIPSLGLCLNYGFSCCDRDHSQKLVVGGMNLLHRMFLHHSPSSGMSFYAIDILCHAKSNGSYWLKYKFHNRTNEKSHH